MVTTVGTLTAGEAVVVGLTDEVAVVGTVGVDLTVVDRPVDVDTELLPAVDGGAVVTTVATVADTAEDDEATPGDDATPTDDGTGDELTGPESDTDADTGVEPAVLLTAVGAAVNVVGPASVDVHEVNRMAVAARPTMKPLRRTRIVRPPLPFP